MLVTMKVFGMKISDGHLVKTYEGDIEDIINEALEENSKNIEMKIVRKEMTN